MADGSGSFSAKRKRWVRLMIPSVEDVIFIALLVLLVFTSLSTRLLGDAGIGWHIRTGQQILAAHAIPRVDLFSSTMAGKAWFAWEWLYDLVVGDLERVLGLNGVVLFTALIISFVFAWTFRLLLRRGANIFIAVVLVLLAVSASMIHFLARPHVLSWLFALVWFHVLDSSEGSAVGAPSEPHCSEKTTWKKHEPWLWLLPVSMLLWANLHGGFLVGFVLLGIFWLNAMWLRFATADVRLEDILQKRAAGKRAWKLALVTVLAALATLVNPYGLSLHVHIYKYLSNRFLMDHIDEFQSPNFHGVAQKCFAILLLLAFVTAAAKVRRFTVSEVLIVVFAISSGLFASRNIPIASLLLVLVTGPLLTRAIEDVFERTRVAVVIRRLSSMESSLRGHLWAVAALALICAIAANGGRVGSTHLMQAHFDERRFPLAAVRFIEQSGTQEPILAPDYWGGYLIYRLYPKTKVVADDRHDLYGEEFLKCYLRTMRGEPGWEEFIASHNVRVVLVPKASPLANTLTGRTGWRVDFADDTAVLFERSAAS